MKRFRFTSLIGFLIASILLNACGGASPTPTVLPDPTATSAPTSAPTPTQVPEATPAEPLTLTSAAFAPGDTIPDRYTYSLGAQCAGENVSPPLSWTGVPAGTRSLVVTMIDPDGGNWVHWVQFNIPAEVAELPEAMGGPDIGVSGMNHFGELGYGGPCPPGGTHNYVFTLYALDTVLSVAEGASRVQVETAMRGHVLSQAELIGQRSRE
jgi:hypothetical protein